VITGLPRSGTSFLCAKVNEFKNAAVINEPPELFNELKGGSVEGLTKVFEQYRCAIGQGKPVYNKIKEGRFIEDTRLEDCRSLHIHQIDNEGFTLGIKNTLIFMAMLSDIADSRDYPKIIASIRHPYDCIGSWHSVAFPHLKQAKPNFLTSYSSGCFAKPLAELLCEEELIVRSARLWLLLAKTLLAAKGKIHVVRYEDMVTKPEVIYQGIGKYIDIKLNRTHDMKPSRPVRRRDGFSDVQRDTIGSICSKIAAVFGYKLS